MKLFILGVTLLALLLSVAMGSAGEYCDDNWGANVYLKVQTINELTGANITNMANLSATNNTAAIAWFNSSTLTGYYTLTHPSCFGLPALSASVNGLSWVTIPTTGSSGYVSRTRMFLINASAEDYQKYYLVPTGSGFYYSLYVSSVAGAQLAGASVTMSKVMPTGPANVSDSYTDSSGLALNYLVQQPYTFTISKAEYNTLTISITPDPDNPVSYVRLNTIGTAYHWPNYRDNTTANCVYSSTSGIVNCTIADALATSSICLKIYKSGVFNYTYFNMSCGSGASFWLAVNTSLMTGINNTIRYIVITNNSYVIKDGTIIPGTNIPMGYMGIFIGLIIVILLSTLFASNPATVIFMGTLGFCVAVAFSLITSPLLAVGSLIVVALILLIKVKS